MLQGKLQAHRLEIFGTELGLDGEEVGSIDEAL